MYITYLTQHGVKYPAESVSLIDLIDLIHTPPHHPRWTGLHWTGLGNLSLLLISRSITDCFFLVHLPLPLPAPLDLHCSSHLTPVRELCMSGMYVCFYVCMYVCMSYEVSGVLTVSYSLDGRDKDESNWYSDCKADRSDKSVYIIKALFSKHPN